MYQASGTTVQYVINSTASEESLFLLGSLLPVHVLTVHSTKRIALLSDCCVEESTLCSCHSSITFCTYRYTLATVDRILSLPVALFFSRSVARGDRPRGTNGHPNACILHGLVYCCVPGYTKGTDQGTQSRKCIGGAFCCCGLESMSCALCCPFYHMMSVSLRSNSFNTHVYERDCNRRAMQSVVESDRRTATKGYATTGTTSGFEIEV